jgi:hypothetical protein
MRSVLRDWEVVLEISTVDHLLGSVLLSAFFFFDTIFTFPCI